MGDHIGTVTIGGSIISGTRSAPGALLYCGGICCDQDIGAIVVKGSIVGNTAKAYSPVLITAKGQLVQGATTDVAIGSITVGGKVEYANILGGFRLLVELEAVNADAQIGKVTIGGDWIASNLAAGVWNGYSNDVLKMNFGNADDAPIPAGQGVSDSATIDSRIGTLTIGGNMMGTPSTINSTDHFGIVAQHILAARIGGYLLPNLPVDWRTTLDVTLKQVQ